MPKSRKQYSPREKAAILREHLIDHLPVSDACEKHAIHPTLFYQWQKMFLENLPSLFDRKQCPIRRQNAHSRFGARLVEKQAKRGEPISIP